MICILVKVIDPFVICSDAPAQMPATTEGVVIGEGGPMPIMMPGHYSPQMMMMMQHLYAQQMAHYMQ
jgi:hypothetical protein